MPLGASRLSFLAKTAEVAAVEQRTATDVNNLGDAVLTTSQYKFGGSSIRFDGDASSDQRVVSPAATGIGTGDYTIECWIRLDELNFLHAITYIGDIAHYIHQDGKIAYYHDTGTLGTNVSISTNTWHHVAWSRESGTVRMFVDGNLEGTITGETDALPSNDLIIGCKNANGQDMRGYLDEYRFSNTALYTASFTAPTAPFVNDNSTTKLLMHADGTDGDAVLFDDNGDRAPVGIQAIADAQISTTQSQFGSNSIYFDGTGDYLDTTLPSSFGTGDFTIEGWVYVTDSRNQGMLHLTSSGFPGAVNDIAIRPGTNINNWSIYYGTNSSATASPSVACLTNTWYHVALVRSSGTTKLYVDGTEAISVSDTTNYTLTNLLIGGYYSTSYLLNGYIDELRVSSTARYTSGFTPSTTAFTNDANTLLLLHAEEGASGSTEIFDDNGATLPTPPTTTYELAAVSTANQIELFTWTEGNSTLTTGSLITDANVGTILCNAISPNGEYMAVGGNGGDYLNIYQRNGVDSWSKITNPSTLPGAQVQDLTWSGDSTYLGCAVYAASPTAGFVAYSRSGSTFTSLTIDSDSAHEDPEYTLGCQTDATGTWWVLGERLKYDGVDQGWTAFAKRTGSTIEITQMENSAFRSSRVSMTSDALYAFSAAESGQWMYVWKRSGDTWTELSSPFDTNPDEGRRGISTSPDKQYTIQQQNYIGNDPYSGLVVYSNDGDDTWTKLPADTTFSPNYEFGGWYGDGCRWSADGNYWFMSGNTLDGIPILQIWKNNGDDTFTEQAKIEQSSAGEHYRYVAVYPGHID